MFCNNCGKPNPDGVSFCASCGAPLAGAAGTPAPLGGHASGEPHTSGMAIASLVLGILGITALLGLILGIVSLVQINRSRGRLRGQGLAIAGICVSAFALLVLIPVTAACVKMSRRVQPLQITSWEMARRGGPAGTWATAPGQPGGPACPAGAPVGSGAGAKTEELGTSGAKLEIIAVVPVAHGCHATSIAELKKAYRSHPNDIHLTIVDLWGPDATRYRDRVGATFTRITINGKYQFDLGGRNVALEKVEGGTYRPADLGPIIGAELKK